MSVPWEMEDVKRCVSTNLGHFLVDVNQGTFWCLTSGHVKVISGLVTLTVWMLFSFLCVPAITFQLCECHTIIVSMGFPVDIDECKDTKDICSGGTCSNLPGSHLCTCVGGLVPSGDGKQCLGKLSYFKTIFLSFLLSRVGFISCDFCCRCQRVSSECQHLSPGSLSQHPWLLWMYLWARVFC